MRVMLVRGALYLMIFLFLSQQASAIPGCFFVEFHSVTVEPTASSSSFTLNCGATGPIGTLPGSDSSWLTVAFPSGSSPGTYSYSVNPSTTPRVATIKTDRDTLTVTQAGAGTGTSFAFSIATAVLTGYAQVTSSSSVTVPPFASEDRFTLTTIPTKLALEPTPTSNVPWLTVELYQFVALPGGVTWNFYYSANPSATTRTGTITFGGGLATFTVTQRGLPVLSFASTGTTVNASAGAGTVPLTVIPSDGQWMVASDSPWLSVTPATGVGSASLNYSYSASSNTSRQAMITVTVVGACGPLTCAPPSAQFVIRQPAFPTLSVPSTGATVTAPAGTGTIPLTVTPSDAQWTAISDSPWLSVTPGSGTGSATLNYSYSASPGTSRQATITIKAAGAAVLAQFVVTQQAVAVDISPRSIQVSDAAGSGGLNITTASPAVQWQALSNANWLTIAPASGAGSGTLTYSFSRNDSGVLRTGLISINGTVFTVAQAAVTITFAPTSIRFAARGETGTVSLNIVGSGSYPWAAVSSAAWLTATPASGTGSATLTVAATPNNSSLGRSASLTILGAVLSVTQDPLPGTLTISPSAANISGSGGSVTVTAAPSPPDFTAWAVSGTPSWLTVSFAANFLTFTASQNSTGTARTATLQIGPKTFTLTQTVEVAGTPLVTGVTNAASYATGIVSPGELVTIFGTGIGPTPLVGLGVAESGAVSRFGSDTQVFFDSIPAPILYASLNQTSAQVPYGLGGNTTTSLTVRYRGVASAPLSLAIGGSAPGLFALDSSGAGQGAVLNQDFSLNSSSNPANKSSVVVFYGTGEGQTSPAGNEGQFTPLTAPFLQPILPVSVQIGGKVAQVLFVGEAPSAVSGLLQINALVPPEAPSGSSIPVSVCIGTRCTQTGITIAVQ